MSENITEQLKQQDLSPAAVARATQPKKTWFVKRGDGMIFACEEGEAWALMENRSNWMRKDFRLIGVSDGTTFVRIIKESGARSVAILQQIQALEKDLERYRKTEERMVFEDLIDPEGTDPSQAGDRAKIKRVREIIAELDGKIQKLDDDYRSVTKLVNKTAFDAELEAARANAKATGRIEYPSNQNIITPGASPKERRKVMRAMSQDDE